MKIDITRLSEDCAFIVNELQKELGLEPGGGQIVTAEQAPCSCAECADGKIVIRYRTLSEFSRLLLAVAANSAAQYKISLGGGFERTGFMADNSRNAVLNADSLKKLIRKSALLGLNRLYLYMEDTYEVQGHPYFGYFRGRFTAEELRKADGYAAKFGITLVPCIQVLAHLNQIFRWTPYLEINDCEDILLADDERTYALIDSMFRSLRGAVSGTEINIGMDEAYLAGLGKHLSRFGYQDRTEMLNRHVQRVAEIASKYGFRCAMWSDMYFRLIYGGEYYKADLSVNEEALSKVPKNVELIYWDYYSTDESRFDAMMQKHLRIGNDVQFAGGAWKWTGFLPDNEYAMRITLPAVRAARRNHIRTFFLTGWGDNGGECSVFAVLPALYYFSALNYGLPAEGVDFEKQFELLAGMPFQAFLALEQPNRASGASGARKPNISKYYLYNDCFMGVMDSVLCGKESEGFALAADILRKRAGGEFAYLFDTAAALADVLELKCGLGVKTRLAYRNGDKDGLVRLADVYQQAEDRIQAFYEAFRAQWMKENKPHGFDVQDIRIGGLLLRIRDCRRRILAYCRGETQRIEELEEDVLPFMGNNECKDEDIVLYSNYALIATQNAL